MTWYLRWHVSRLLIHLGIFVAPNGTAKSLLVSHLDAFGRQVLDDIAAAKGGQ